MIRRRRRSQPAPVLVRLPDIFARFTLPLRPTDQLRLCQLVNPGFETGDLTGWTIVESVYRAGAWVVAADKPHGGSYYLTLNDFQGEIVQRICVQEGAAGVAIELWSHPQQNTCEGYGDYPFELYIRWFGPDGSLLLEEDAVELASEPLEWQQQTVEFAIPEGAAALEVAIYSFTSDECRPVFGSGGIDDIVLTWV